MQASLHSLPPIDRRFNLINSKKKNFFPPQTFRHGILKSLDSSILPASLDVLKLPFLR